jgi:hypothetical protein
MDDVSPIALLCSFLYVLEALRGFPLLQIPVSFDFVVVLVDVDVGSDLLHRERPELFFPLSKNILAIPLFFLYVVGSGGDRYALVAVKDARPSGFCKLEGRRANFVRVNELRFEKLRPVVVHPVMSWWRLHMRAMTILLPD